MNSGCWWLGGPVLLVLGLGMVWVEASEGAGERAAARVVILANREDPDSLRMARHYAEVRGVPAGNVVALPMPRGEALSWREFVAAIWEPLRGQLVPQLGSTRRCPR